MKKEVLFSMVTGGLASSIAIISDFKIYDFGFWLIYGTVSLLLEIAYSKCINDNK